MRKKIAENTVTYRIKVFLLIDESTSHSRKATSVVVLKTFFREEYPGEAYTYL
jgi:hypothetical protein